MNADQPVRSSAHTGAAEWIPKGRPPIGQYRVTLLLTGDDIGPDALAWLIEHQLGTHGHHAFVETMTHLHPTPDPTGERPPQ